MEAEKKRNVLILAAEEHSSMGDSYFQYRIRLAYVNAEGQLRNHGDSFGEDPGLADLEVTAYLNSDDARKGRPVQPYGFKVEYRDVFSVQLGRAEAMARTLRGVQRKLDRMTTELGYAETFAAYVARVAKALGAKCVRLADDRSYAEWRYVGPDDAALWIEGKREAFAGRHAPAAASA